MFDFENPFKEAADQAEEKEIIEEAAPDWETAEWKDVYNRPARNVAVDKFADEMKAAHDKEKQEMFENFHAKSARRRKERIQIDALRYAGLALCCGLLAYVCADHAINWLAWILGFAGGAFAIVSSYGFGIAREMGR